VWTYGELERKFRFGRLVPIMFGFMFLAGVFFFLKGFWVFRDYKIVADTPLIPIRSLALGVVSIRGKAQSEHSLVSPVGGTPCCLYKVDLTRMGSRGGKTWTVMFGSTFSLADDTGKVLVDAHNVDEEEYDVPLSHAGEMEGDELARKLDYAVPDWPGDSTYRVKEFLVLPGEEYQVTGRCVENPDSEDATDRYLICKNGNQGTLAISSTTKHDGVQTDLLSNGVGMISVGTAFILAGGFFFVQELLEAHVMTLGPLFGPVSVIGLVVAIVVLYAVIVYNELVRLRNENDRAWANIDVLLKQRHDEVPNLVEMVKGYMQYEKETLVALTEARAAAVTAVTVGEKVQADLVLTGALRGLFAAVENYPQLKANEHFLKLQGHISELEERIADRREFYNEDVTTFNTRIWQFPEFYMAFLMRLKPREMFKVSGADRQPPAKPKLAGVPNSSAERNAQLTKVMEAELLDLESERQRGSVTPEEYTEAKTALDEIMKRRAARSGDAN
jgi:LemA protein